MRDSDRRRHCDEWDEIATKIIHRDSRSEKELI
jgi:hypothetical protein